jgi:TonB-linked SusC/RagA family outer membrane protein
MRKFTSLILCFLLAISQLWAQNRTVTGKVVADKNNPISGASVVAFGSKVGASTEADGSFKLTVPTATTTLVVSSLNYKTENVSIAGKTSVTVKLESTAGDISEVVVQVPYGTVKKKNFTGAEATINSTTIAKQQVTDFTRVLDGLIPGVQTTNGTGSPGSNAAIRVRGIGSINASAAPLYVLNGVPFDGDLTAISLDDIETVTVLKDAAASALYGSRAANGVIMVTTKKGAKGRSSTGATITHGFGSRGIPEYDRVNQQQYYELFWEAIRNGFVDGGDSYATAGTKASAQLTDQNHLVYNAYSVAGGLLVDPITGKLNPNAKLLWTDSWSDALFQNSAKTNANINFSGGSDKSDYFFSVGYLDEEGTAKFTGYKRFNTRLNVNTAATNWLNTGINLDASFGKYKGVTENGTATSNPFYYSRNMGPIYPVYQYDANGNTFIDSVGGKKLDWGNPDQMGTRPYAGNSNLLGSLALDEQSSGIINGNASGYLEVKLPYNFAFKTTFGINLYDDYSTSYQNNQFGDAQNVKGRSTKSQTRQSSYTINQILSWKKDFAKHSVTALAGHENYKLQSNVLSLTRSGFAYPFQTELDNGTNTESDLMSHQDSRTLESYFSNVNYSYDQKYSLSASVRTDGSSRFASASRWGTFYSAGLAWRVSQENFLSNVKWVNDLKIRGSYGESGNENIGLNYSYNSYYYSQGTNPTPGSQTPTYQGPTRLENNELKWEKNKSLNIGFDGSFFKNRLQVTVDFFNRASSDLLFDVPQPLSSGFTSRYENVGSMKNFGFEYTIGYNAIRKKNFDWRIDFNLTHYKNEITAMPPSKPEIIRGSTKLSVGHSIYDYWLREFAGVDQATGNPLFYKDIVDATGKVTGRTVTDDINGPNGGATYYYVGTALPDFSGGITNSFRYKSFDLSILTTFSYGGLMNDGNYGGIMHAGSYGTAWSTDILNRWQKPGDITNVPRLNPAVPTVNLGANTRFLIDRSYINIKNITLSYTLSGKALQNLHVTGLKFFTSIDNAYLFTAKKGSNPQGSFSGASDATYPPYRIISAGLNFKL